MSSVGSPRALSSSAAQQKEGDDVYRTDVKGFSAILTELVSISNALTVLGVALGAAGTKNQLAFNVEDKTYTFSRKDLRSASSLFAKHILALKNYFRVSKKKVREPVEPGTFSGTYTPVFAGTALRTFFNGGNFGPRFPIEVARTGQAGEALMDQLPLVQQGYLLRNTSTMLFYIYAHANGTQDTQNAQYASSDAVMDNAFGGSIPADFFSYKDAVTGKPIKVSMDEAVASGLVQRKLNTYDAVKLSREQDMIRRANQGKPVTNEMRFDPRRFNTYFFQNIASANYPNSLQLTRPAFADVARALADPQNLALMLAEHRIVKDVSEEWAQLIEPARKVQRDARKKVKDAERKATRSTRA